MRTTNGWRGAIAAAVGAVVLLGGCGSDDGDGDASTAATTAQAAASETTEATRPKHPCDLLSRDDVNRLTGLNHTKTERSDSTPGSTFNSVSCVYSLEEPADRVPKKASVLLSINRASDARELSNTGPGSFLAGPSDKPIEGIAGATETGAANGEAAARFGDERIVFVRIEANAPVTDTGYQRTDKAIEVLKAFIAKGA